MLAFLAFSLSCPFSVSYQDPGDRIKNEKNENVLTFSAELLAHKLIFRHLASISSLLAIMSWLFGYPSISLPHPIQPCHH